uniref:Uncharacterized protein n=1 Tax=Candidatus Kentrum sp. FW TaxID=2126338 RepID=A0A450S9M7_9GAMM|nr:MAG: hypothetical protein BECKFW1821B_GA0114236_100430 [Candidatus Kentron sp. FW]
MGTITMEREAMGLTTIRRAMDAAPLGNHTPGATATTVAHAEFAHATRTETAVSMGCHEEGIGGSYRQGRGADEQNGNNDFRYWFHFTRNGLVHTKIYFKVSSKKSVPVCSPY